MEKYKCYHFSRNDDCLGYGDGRKIVLGETLSVDCDPKCCQCGLHGSVSIIDALGYASGSHLWLVEIWGKLDKNTDKVCGRNRKAIIEYGDILPLIVEFVKWCADRVAESAEYAVKYAAKSAEYAEYAKSAEYAAEYAVKYAAKSAEYAEYAKSAEYAKYAESAAEYAEYAVKYAAKSAKYAAEYAAEYAVKSAKYAAEYAEYAEYAKSAEYAVKYAAKSAEYAESAEYAKKERIAQENWWKNKLSQIRG